MPKELELDCQKAIDYGVKWIGNCFKKSNAKVAVIGISGGSDSALTAYLMAKAIGGGNVIGVMLPEDDVTPEEDIRDAEEVIKSLGIKKGTSI